jgi:NAD(P)H-dependent FMN reductase
MKVLAIVASARKTGNSEILAKTMLANLPATVEKSLLRLEELTIKPCRACYACLGTGKDCVIDDDFNHFLAQVKAADAVIIAAPVYFLGMHTRLKLLCDRLISVLNEANGYSGRRCVVAVPYGVEGWQGYGVEATVSFARFLHLDVVGVLPVHAANPGEAVRPEILAKAAELARRLLPEATKDFPLQDVASDPAAIACAACGSSILRLNGAGEVSCVLCGAAGRLDATALPAQNLTCRWENPEHFRYSPAGMTEHGERLESIKQDFIARRHELAELRKPYKALEFADKLFVE